MPPFLAYRGDTLKSDYISADLYNRVFGRMQYDNALCLRLCLETGLRVGDALKVKAEDIRGRTLYYTAEKTGKQGKKVLSHTLVKELLRNSCGGGYVFKGRDDPNKHRTRQAVWTDIKKASANAGLTKNVTPHSARKTYAVGVYHDKGIQQAEKELQHDKLETTMLYVFSDLLSGDGFNTLEDKKLFTTVYKACYKALEDFSRQFDFTNSRK